MNKNSDKNLNKNLKIALVHDYLKEYGGAERVLEALHEIYPLAPVYVAWKDLSGLGPHKARFDPPEGGWDIRTSWMQKVPFVSRLFSPLRFLAPLIWESFNFSDYDLVISSSSWYMPKGIITKPGTLHICYCHTPPRYLYGYPTALDWQKYWPVKIYSAIVNHFLRIWDYTSSQRVGYFIANSKVVAARIKKFYQREAIVIYPPVNLVGADWIKGDSLTSDFFGFHSLRDETSDGAQGQRRSQGKTSKIGQAPRQQEPYFLFVSRFVRAKHADLAIEACNKLKLPLKLVGAGREEEQLKAIAGKTIEFLGEVSDEKLAELYANCRALIFPAEEEDFGIVPVEAMSFGKPVVAYKSGGVVETVIEGKTGVFFNELTVDSLVEAMRHLDKLKILGEDCQKQAEKFSKKRFKKEVLDFVEEKLKK